MRELQLELKLLENVETAWRKVKHFFYKSFSWVKVLNSVQQNNKFYKVNLKAFVPLKELR